LPGGRKKKVEGTAIRSWKAGDEKKVSKENTLYLKRPKRSRGLSNLNKENGVVGTMSAGKEGNWGAPGGP